MEQHVSSLTEYAILFGKLFTGSTRDAEAQRRNGSYNTGAGLLGSTGESVLAAAWLDVGVLLAVAVVRPTDAAVLSRP